MQLFPQNAKQPTTPTPTATDRCDARRFAGSGTAQASSAAAPRPNKCSAASFASAARPCCASHRGDSGTQPRCRPRPTASAGATAASAIHRQTPSSVPRAPSANTAKIPADIKTLNRPPAAGSAAQTSAARAHAIGVNGHRHRRRAHGRARDGAAQREAEQRRRAGDDDVADHPEPAHGDQERPASIAIQQAPGDRRGEQRTQWRRRGHERRLGAEVRAAAQIHRVDHRLERRARERDGVAELEGVQVNQGRAQDVVPGRRHLGCMRDGVRDDASGAVMGSGAGNGAKGSPQRYHCSNGMTPGSLPRRTYLRRSSFQMEQNPMQDWLRLLMASTREPMSRRPRFSGEPSAKRPIASGAAGRPADDGAEFQVFAGARREPRLAHPGTAWPARAAASSRAVRAALPSAPGIGTRLQPGVAGLHQSGCPWT